MKVERDLNGSVTAIRGMGRRAAVMRKLFDGAGVEAALVDWFLDYPSFKEAWDDCDDGIWLMQVLEAYDPGEVGSDRRINLLRVMLACLDLLKHSEADNKDILERLSVEVLQHLEAYIQDRDLDELRKNLLVTRCMGDDTKQDSLVKRIADLVDSAVEGGVYTISDVLKSCCNGVTFIMTPGENEAFHRECARTIQERISAPPLDEDVTIKSPSFPEEQKRFLKEMAGVAKKYGVLGFSLTYNVETEDEREGEEGGAFLTGNQIEAEYDANGIGSRLTLKFGTYIRQTLGL